MTGTPDEALALIRPFLAEREVIHRSSDGRKSDLGGLKTFEVRPCKKILLAWLMSQIGYPSSLSDPGPSDNIVL